MGVAFSQSCKIAEINNLNAERSLVPSSPGSFFSDHHGKKDVEEKIAHLKEIKRRGLGDVGGRERGKEEEKRTGRG